MCRSVPQMDAILTLTSTSVRPNCGLGTSLISMPGADVGLTTASMVFDMRMALGCGSHPVRNCGGQGRAFALRQPSVNKKRWANQQVYHAEGGAISAAGRLSITLSPKGGRKDGAPHSVGSFPVIVVPAPEALQDGVVRAWRGLRMIRVVPMFPFFSHDQDRQQDHQREAHRHQTKIGCPGIFEAGSGGEAEQQKHREEDGPAR